MPYLTSNRPSPETIDSKILSAALKLFVENGFHRVSVHEVQKLADVSMGSIYKYFDGKEGIAEALYRHILNEIEHLVDSVIENNLSARAQCEALIAEFFNHTEAHADIISYVFHAKHSDFIPEFTPICDASPMLKMQAIVQRGMDEGEFRKMDSRIATTTIFGSMFRLIQQRLDGVIKKPLPQYTEQVFGTIWGGIALYSTSDNQISIGLNSSANKENP